MSISSKVLKVSFTLVNQTYLGLRMMKLNVHTVTSSDGTMDIIVDVGIVVRMMCNVTGVNVDGRKLLDFMTARFKYLEDQVSRDFAGGMANRLGEYREVKYWKEAIERGEFNSTSEGLEEFDKDGEA